MVAEPGVAPGIEDYESSVMLFHYPATGILFIRFFDFLFPNMRSQLSSNCFLGTLNGLGLLPFPLMLHVSRHDYVLGCSLLKIPSDQPKPYDFSEVYAHAQLEHMEHKEDACLLLLEFDFLFDDCMGDRQLRNLPIDCYHHEILGEHDQWSIDSC